MSQERLTLRVRKAIDAAPCSVRELARDAGVPHSTLVRITSGERLATAAVAGRIAAALAVWGRRCRKLANDLDQALADFIRED
jgi:transcriptional regulator with XRE-family HTH domain